MLTGFDDNPRYDASFAPRLDQMLCEALEQPTVLVGGDRPAGDFLARAAERAGLQCIGSTSLTALLWSAVSTVPDLLLLDLRGEEAHDWLEHPLAPQVMLKGRRVCVLVDLASLERAFALLEGVEAEVLCDPSLADIVTMLVSAGLRPMTSGPATMRDIAGDGEGVRLERLSEEVRRLAQTLERLSGSAKPASSLAGSTSQSGQALSPPPSTQKPQAAALPAQPAMAERSPIESRASAAEIRTLIRARRLRDEFLPADLFADPAWDMLLDLLAARLAGQRVSVSSLCIAAAVPPTTALRWMTQLTERKILVRLADPTDGRRVFIDLTDETAEAALQWVDKVRRRGGLLAPPR
ncbi:DNA-binding MarR family transcriptional regulator/ActR/RegA family two-component response regulator [Sphingobium sp. B2D3A]|uniref:MarR family transcriptional regulator n=1 Tax=unclassified Sphingobium TaxID=2611147 RepID=UPI0022240419|nr:MULTISPECIES: MarR family transcriptional regulator [unclassified Sphingobium]MCW2336345.1 DNA-binding MarR family transcriptional regulator/ActR/RegA family two-component response regulator [Sphingobium sp. B2D3A]MCW2386099.1 DNA-binding MarR family transcriptional regulator/ActR/RegA family two-component response regulator [Sphingobium sp. B2D3D]